MTYPDNIRAAFREVTLGLMSWQDPPLMGAREYRRLEFVHEVRRPYGKESHYGRAAEVDPFDVSADWEERA